jgi:hypothetical protein
LIIFKVFILPHSWLRSLYANTYGSQQLESVADSATGPVVNGIIVVLYKNSVKKREIDYNQYVICFILEVVFGLCII